MTIQKGEIIIKEVPIYFHPTSEAEIYVRDHIVTPRTTYMEHHDAEHHNIEDDENGDCVSYEWYISLQALILVLGLLFFPVWCFGLCFINSEYENVSKLAFINFLLGCISVCTVCFIIIVIQTYGK